RRPEQAALSEIAGRDRILSSVERGQSAFDQKPEGPSPALEDKATCCGWGPPARRSCWKMFAAGEQFGLLNCRAPLISAAHTVGDNSQEDDRPLDRLPPIRLHPRIRQRRPDAGQPR